MGGVDLGSVTARLEVDTSGIDQSIARATAALNEIGATAEQTAQYLTQLMNVPEEYREAFLEPLVDQANAIRNVATEAERLAAPMDEGAESIRRIGTEAEKSAGLFQGFGDALTKGLAFGGAAAIGAKAAEMLISAVKGIPDAFSKAITETAAYAEKLDKMALVTGLSTEMLQGLSKAAVETGSSSEMLVRSVARLEVAVANDSKAFQSLGLSLNDLKNSSPEEMLRKVAERLLSMTDVTERNAAATKLFGRSYMEVIPSLEQYLQSAERYVNLTDDQIAASKSMDDALDAASTAWEDLQKQFGAILAQPAVVQLIQDIAAALAQMAQVIQDNRGEIADFANTLANGFQNAASVALNSVQSLIAGFETGVRTIAAQAAELKKILSFEINPITGLQNIYGQGVAGIQGIGAAAKQLARPTITWNEYVPAPGRPRVTPGPGGGGGGTGNEAYLKQLQAEMDRLSGKKAQEEMDRIAEAVRRIGVEGVADLGALGKQVETLAQQGAKVPPILDAAVQKRALDQVEKDAESAWKSILNTVEKSEKQITENFLDELDAQADGIEQSAEQRQFIAESLAEAEMALMEQTAQASGDSYDYQLQQANAYYEEIRRRLEEQARAIGLTEAEVNKLMSAWGKVEQAQVGQIKAAQNAEKWGMALRGVAAAAEMIGGKFGKLLGTAAEIGYTLSQVNWSAKNAKGGWLTQEKQQAIGQASYLLGSYLQSSALEENPSLSGSGSVGKYIGGGAASGAGQGFQYGGPIGAAVGAVIGGITAWSESKKIKQQYQQDIADLVKQIQQQFGGSTAMVATTERYGIDIRGAIRKAESGGTLDDITNAMAELEKRAQATRDAVGGLAVMIDNLTYTDAEGKIVSVFSDPKTISAAAQSFSITFWALYQREGIAAIAQLRPQFDALKQQLSDFGIDANALGLSAVERMLNLASDPRIAALLGVSAGSAQLVRGSMEAGFMDTTLLSAQTEIARATYQELQKAGLSEKEAGQAMAADLAALAQAYEATGQELPADISAALAAAGIEVLPTQLTVLEQIRDILAAQNAAIGEAKNPWDAWNRAVEAQYQADRNVNPGVPGPPGSNPGGSSSPGGVSAPTPPSAPSPGFPWPIPSPTEEGYQHGGVGDFGRGTPVMLHGPEAIVPLNERWSAPLMDQMASSVGVTNGGSAGTVVYNPTFVIDPLMNNESRTALGKFLIDEFVKASRNNPRVKSATNHAANGGR